MGSKRDQDALDEIKTAKSKGAVLIAEVEDRTRVKVAGVVSSVVLQPRTHVPALEADVYDGSGTLVVVWLGRRDVPGIEPGRRLVLEGLVCSDDGCLTMFNPRYTLEARAGD